MILLNRQSLTAAYMVPAVSMSLQIKEREATATLTPESTDGIGIGSWMQDDREPGAGTVWRVRSIQQAFATRTPTVQLEHIIATLKDRILFGEIKPGTITGNPSDTTCTARQAVEYILAQQSDWTLGQFDYESVSNPYKFDGDTLFEALETVTNSLEDAYWTYDMSAYPFTLNIIQHSADVDSEMRAGRNLKTISRTVDKSGMFTRFYPIGKDDLHVSGNYVEKNVNLYGVISKVETDQSLDTTAELTAWANERLNAHAQPNVSITVEGLELSRETGEPLDSLTIGRVCRVPLPEFDTMIQERIVEISYTDKINQPEVVKITLANSRQDVTKIIADALKRSGRGGRGSARQQKEDHAWFEDTNEHVSMTAIGVIGVDAQGKPNWTRMSEFIADGQGLHAKVETQMGEVTGKIATLEINEDEIRTEVASTQSDLHSFISQTADEIEIAVATASSTMYGVIAVTATNFQTEVSRRAKVYVQINDPALDPAIRPSLREGDIWVKTSRVQNWNDMSSRSWTTASSLDWNKYNGAEQFVWDGQKERWEPVSDKGLMGEWGTRIEQTEKNIRLIAQAVDAIDPEALAQASIDVSAEAITLAVSTAKSELYSVIRQTATNITQEVVNDIEGISSYVEQTASSLVQAVARKNKVFVQMTDPASGETVIEGDIWIKSAGNDKIHPSWSDLSAKTWSSQSTTNWREFYEGYWYVRKNGAWSRMNANADVVEIGTKLEQDENHIALIARDVDRNHVEMGSRLQVTAQQIRSEVHSASSNLYSVIRQTSTSIMSSVTSITDGMSSTILQTKSQIALVVTKKDGEDVVDAASIVAGINKQSGSYVKIAARNINLTGYVTATELNAVKATIDNLKTGVTRASYIKTTQFNISDNYFTLNNNTIRLRSITIDGVTHHYLGTD